MTQQSNPENFTIKTGKRKREDDSDGNSNENDSVRQNSTEEDKPQTKKSKLSEDKWTILGFVSRLWSRLCGISSSTTSSPSNTVIEPATNVIDSHNNQQLQIVESHPIETPPIPIVIATTINLSPRLDIRALVSILRYIYHHLMTIIILSTECILDLCLLPATKKISHWTSRCIWW